ncbi:MAG: hemolysin family protein [Candidatus Gracilibacteria bacterium]|nr:hemolysin family protein [Candidatus Gracilibacteria bacterium]
MEKLFLLFLFLLLYGFFSGAETALFSLGPEKIQALRNRARTKKEKLRVARLEHLKSDANRLLIIILVGNTIVNVAASSMATIIALQLGEQFGLSASSNSIIGIVTGVMTFLILIFGEFTPKAIAYQSALRFSLIAAPVLKFLGIVLWPIVTPIALVSRKFSGKTRRAHGLNEDELKAAIELSEREGRIKRREKELFERVLEFDDHTVETIMTPRSKMFALPDNLSTPEALQKIANASYSRIPVFHGSADNIIGVLKVQSLVEEFLKPDFREKNLANLSLLPPMKVPLTMKIDTLLRKFQQEKIHLALVLDEHGALIGLITLEDVLEEIFGEFEDEADQEVPSIRRNGRRSFVCAADTELEQIETTVRQELGEKQCPTRWPWAVQEENNTLSYFLLEQFERFPREGEILRQEEDEHRFSFRIQKTDGEKIRQVELTID